VLIIGSLHPVEFIVGGGERKSITNLQSYLFSHGGERTPNLESSYLLRQHVIHGLVDDSENYFIVSLIMIFLWI
jgi:hypothetical protein